MDVQTLHYYAEHAAQIAQHYESAASPMARYFEVAFPRAARVLDVGAGSGRDLAALLAAGYDAWGVEPTQAMITAALAQHPQLSGRLIPAALPALGEPFGGNFDGIVCSAVLMHVPQAQLFDAAVRLRDLLRPGGRLLVSLPSARHDVDANGRDAHGRLFEPYAPDEVQLLLERLGFQAIGRWQTDDALARAHVQWCTLLLERRTSGVLRAVDQIEAILNRDRKSATYKLALFRALAELATQQPRVATWCADGQVGVPISCLAQKWLEYYWPIFAAERFVPQSAAEGAGGAQPVSFRAALQALMQPYFGRGEHGGLSAWWLDCARGRLAPDRAALQQAALRAIAQALRDGPVRFAGGALHTGTVFAFDTRTGLVLMHADLWRELALLGYWIADAVVLRWAELTERFGRRLGVRAADVLPLLLARPEPARATALAREVFRQHMGLRCTWSGTVLRERFDVDHVIPFALWGNNDLWNLLPVAVSVNRDKSDRLPAAALVVTCRERIVEAWASLREAMPDSFDEHAARLTGRRIPAGAAWQDELFARLREAIELTALQRGVERWAPRVPPPFTHAASS